jgi:hypothetical protein
MAACDSVDAADLFDFEAAAELFSVHSRKRSRQFGGYRRFDRAADAIRFAMEDLPPKLLQGICLEVDEMRFDSTDIRRLYASDAFTLVRRAVP